MTGDKIDDDLYLIAVSFGNKLFEIIEGAETFIDFEEVFDIIAAILEG